jgi:hypothetical protein
VISRRFEAARLQLAVDVGVEHSVDGAIGSMRSIDRIRFADEQPIASTRQLKIDD